MEKQFSLTVVGAIVAIAGSLLVHFGLSETCSNEIASLLPGLIGGLLAYWGRYRVGDITAYGVKK